MCILKIIMLKIYNNNSYKVVFNILLVRFFISIGFMGLIFLLFFAENNIAVVNTVAAPL